MTMQKNVDLGRWPIRRNVLQSKSQLFSDQIDNQRPIGIAVAISPNDRDRRTDRSQFIQNDFGANVSQMPYFGSVARALDNFRRQLVMRISQNKNPKHRFLKKPGTGKRKTKFKTAPVFLLSLDISA